MDTVFFDDCAYGTRLIGEQCWFSENLRTENFSNGDALPAGFTANQWNSTTGGTTVIFGEGNGPCFEGASAFDPCDDGAEALAVYGRMYNCYAVADGRGLCPAGWHIPTDEEWTQLEDQITSEGFDGTVGAALRRHRVGAHSATASVGTTGIRATGILYAASATTSERTGRGGGCNDCVFGNAMVIPF